MTGQAAPGRLLAPAPDLDPTLRRSVFISRFMAGYFTWYLSRHLNGLRIARWGRPPAQGPAGPIVAYSNHPSWWDAALYALLGQRLFPGRASYAPMDAAMLARYGVLGRIGAFGVDLDSARGAAAFLRGSAAILSRPDSLMWVAAQGRFTDARRRPLGCKPGVARLAEIGPDATFLPMAIEFTFWDERGAEALIAFGPAMGAGDLAAMTRPDRLAHLEAALEATMDRLAADAQARDPARFETLIAGTSGVGGVYDLWRRARAAAQGRRFDPSHWGRG